jgi:RNA polymerase sigma factor (sigma-70 family)
MMAAVSDFIRRLVVSELRGAPDAELLGRFLSSRDEAAFTAVVCKHGPMVFRVCRGVLRNRADAEDAAQATFLVLAQKASSVRKHDSLPSWLHGVALRTARKLRAANSRRQAREGLAVAPQVAAEDLTVREAEEMLHAELEKLPARYNGPLILCYLHGKTHDEAAAELGWTVAVFRGRLERARNKLRDRLTRRGVGFGAAPFMGLLLEGRPDLPAKFAEMTAKASITTAPEAVARGLISSTASHLAQEVIWTMSFTSLKLTGALVLAVVLATGGWFAMRPAPAAPPHAEAKAEEKPKADQSKKEPDANEDGVGINTPIPLREAVEELNRKTDKAYFDTKFTRQPPLGKERRPKAVTVDEVVSAIQGWDRKKFPVADPTYRIFQQIADSKVLPPGARLDFLDQWGLDQLGHSGGKDKYEYRVWGIQLNVMTGKNTGYGFRVREERLDHRIALLPAPGYSWLEGLWPASPRGGYSAGRLVVAFEDDKDAALLITVALTTKGIHDTRVVAFDKDGKRYLPVRQGWGGAASDLVMLRFRLDPKKLPAAQVEYVGIEGITEEGLKYASEAAVKRAQEKGIEVLPFPEVGKPYEFSVTTSDGKAIDSRKLRGKVVLIDCWASWCGPCLRDMPEVKKVYEKWHDKGLEVIGLSLDKDPEAAAAAAKKYEPSWPLVVVPPGEEARELWTQAARIESIPRLLVVDRKGVLRADLSSAQDLEKTVAGLLAEGPEVPPPSRE